MSAGNYDFKIEQGVDKEIEIQILESDGITPLDISSWTFEMHIREKYSSTSTLLEPTITITDGLLGKIKIELTASGTAAMPANVTAVYDIEATVATKKQRVIEGKCYVSPEVTR